MPPAPLTPEAASAAQAADVAQIKGALTSAQGNVGKAARALGVERRTLDRRITALGLRAWLRASYPKRPGAK
jgi:transcriptional regulator of acetoin/glycerol metabolism